MNKEIYGCALILILALGALCWGRDIMAGSGGYAARLADYCATPHHIESMCPAN